MILSVKDLYNQCKTQIERGNGDKKIMISNDDEGNGYHYLFFGMQEGKDFEYDDMFMMSVDENITPVDDVIVLG